MGQYRKVDQLQLTIFQDMKQEYTHASRIMELARQSVGQQIWLFIVCTIFGFVVFDIADLHPIRWIYTHFSYTNKFLDNS